MKSLVFTGVSKTHAESMKVLFLVKKNLPSDKVESKKEIDISFLIDIWDSLGTKKLNLFKRFLKSPYFETDQKLKPLDIFIYVRKLLGKKRPQAIKGEKLLSAISDKNGSLNFESLILAFKHLEKLTENFLIHQEIDNNSITRTKILVQIYKKRQLTNEFIKVAKKYQKLLQSIESTTAKLRNEWWVLDNLFFHQYQSTETRKLEHLEIAEEKIDQLYQIIKLNYLSANINRKKIYDTEQSNTSLNEESEKLKKEFPLTIFAHILQNLIPILEKPSVTSLSYSKFKQFFLEHRKAISPLEQYLIVKHAINVCGRASMNGEPEAYLEFFEWNEFGIEKKLFFITPQISDNEYLNIILAAVFHNQYDKIELWKKECAPFLNQKTELKANDLIHAYVLLNKQDYLTCIEFLNLRFAVQSKNALNYTIRVKTLLLFCFLMVFITTGETEIEFSKCKKNYLEFLDNNRNVNTQRKKYASQYIYLSAKILALCKNKVEYSSNELELEKQKLLSELKNLKLMSMNKWLIEAIHTIKK